MAGLLHHSDQGCTYASEDYRTRLEAHGITCSMSRGYDNADPTSVCSKLESAFTRTRPRDRWLQRRDQQRRRGRANRLPLSCSSNLATAGRCGQPARRCQGRRARKAGLLFLTGRPVLGQFREMAGAPPVRLGDVRHRVGGVVLPGQRRPQRQQCIGFIGALSLGERVGWETLHIEQPDVRRQPWLQWEDPLQLKARLVELRRLG